MLPKETTHTTLTPQEKHFLNSRLTSVARSQALPLLYVEAWSQAGMMRSNTAVRILVTCLRNRAKANSLASRHFLAANFVCAGIPLCFGCPLLSWAAFGMRRSRLAGIYGKHNLLEGIRFR